MSIKGIHKNNSVLAGQFIPESIKPDALDLELLLKEYYRWADLDGNFQKESKKLLDSFSYKSAGDDYLNVFKDTFLRLFPDLAPDVIRHLLKFSKIFYSERGTIDSYKFLFKVLWDVDNINIIYPSKYILKSSDGIWTNKIALNVDNNNAFIKDNPYNEIANKLIVGKKSKSRAFISSAEKLTDNESRLVLENISSDFIANEILEVYDDIYGNNKIAEIRNVATLGSYEIINPGKGYLSGRTIYLNEEGDGKNFNIKISGTSIVNGEITSLSIVNPGEEYVYTKPTLNLSDEYLFDTRFKKNDREEATIKLLFVANYEMPGYYLEKKSLLSDLWKLRDGHYYQEYSYIIESPLDENIIKNPINDLLHPAGLAVFYKKKILSKEINYINFSDSNINFNSLLSNKTDGIIRYSNTEGDYINISTGSIRYGNQDDLYPYYV